MSTKRISATCSTCTDTFARTARSARSRTGRLLATAISLTALLVPGIIGTPAYADEYSIAGQAPYEMHDVTSPSGATPCLSRVEGSQISLTCDWSRTHASPRGGQVTRVVTTSRSTTTENFQSVRVKVGTAGASMHCVTYSPDPKIDAGGGLTCAPRSYGSVSGVKAISMGADNFHHARVYLPGASVPCMVSTAGNMRQIDCTFASEKAESSPRVPLR